MTIHRSTIAVVILAMALPACNREKPSVIIGTTTTVDGSGLLQALRVEFQRQTGITLNAFVAGSGRVLRQEAEGKVKVTITHDPVAEKAFVEKNKPEIYRQFMWNDFIVVGPEADPAGVSASKTAPEAFQRIHKASAKFLSRNDESGTHVKELALWRAAGVTQRTNPNYLPVGQPMAPLLRSASEVQGYALCDRATFDQLEPTLHLKVLFSGDPVLRNVYGLILMRDADENSRTFANWMLSPAGRQVVESLRVRGKQELHWIDSATPSSGPASGASTGSAAPPPR
jgi:tungstate transport system substrate-binding protein